MHAHKVIDALKGSTGAPQLVVPNIGPALTDGFLRWMEDAAQAIADAQHFVFENVPIAEDGQGGFDLPGTTEEEQDIFSEGLVPLPFEACWFETATPIGEMLCFLLEEREYGFDVTPFRFLSAQGGFLQFTGESWEVHRGTPGKAPPMIEILDRFGGTRLFQEHARENGLNADIRVQTTGEVGLVLYLLLMLSSRTSEVRTVPAPGRLNRSRAKKGRAPLPAHRTVSIIPRRLAAELRRQQGQAQEDSHVRASPRIHWRRSHVRTLASGDRIAVPAALVGYRDVGEEVVTHDYRVRL